MKIEYNCTYFEFVALDNLLALGFPPIINTKLEGENGWFSISLFRHMKVLDENNFAYFLSSYEEYFGSENYKWRRSHPGL